MRLLFLPLTLAEGQKRQRSPCRQGRSNRGHKALKETAQAPGLWAAPPPLLSIRAALLSLLGAAGPRQHPAPAGSVPSGTGGPEQPSPRLPPRGPAASLPFSRSAAAWDAESAQPLSQARRGHAASMGQESRAARTARLPSWQLPSARTLRPAALRSLFLRFRDVLQRLVNLLRRHLASAAGPARPRSTASLRCGYGTAQGSPAPGAAGGAARAPPAPRACATAGAPGCSERCGPALRAPSAAGRPLRAPSAAGPECCGPACAGRGAERWAPPVRSPVVN